MLLARIGLFGRAIEFFFALIFLAGGAYFIWRFSSSPRWEWWAAIPGFALAGIGLDNLMRSAAGDFHGMFFLGTLGLGFFAVYLSGRQRWWGIIVGGVLITLAFTSMLAGMLGVNETGGFLLLGLGLTFLLLAVLASVQWAYVPAICLLALGALVGTASTSTFNYLWPAALITAGLLLILQFARKK